jgi:CheY-like chemotaxis protein
MSTAPKNPLIPPNPENTPHAHAAEVRRLVVTIACEIVNPLTSVVGYADLLEMSLKEPQLDLALCTEYVTKLRDYARKTQKKISELAHLAQIPLDDREVEHLLLEAATQRASAKAQLAGQVAVMPHGKQRVIVEHAPQRILVVQPSEAMMEFKRLLLTTLGAQVVCAPGGNAAMKILQNEKVDGVILDDEDEVQTDWTSPRIYDWIVQHKPELSGCVLWTTAMHPSSEIYNVIRRPGVMHMTKPLQMEPMLGAMQQLLRTAVVH